MVPGPPAPRSRGGGDDRGSRQERLHVEARLSRPADKSADKVKAGDFDAVVIPGGYAPDRMRLHEPMVRFVREMDKAGKVVAAICHAGWMLVSADILRGRKATCYAAIRDDLVNAGAAYADAEVVRDGNLITSRKPEDLPAFCRAIIQAVSEGRARSRRAA